MRAIKHLTLLTAALALITLSVQSAGNDQEILTAEEVFEKALSLKGNSETIRREQAVLFEQVLLLKPDYWEAIANLVTLYLSLNRPEKALVYARKAVELKPEKRQSHVGLCQSLRLSGRQAEAVAFLEKALKIFPCDPILAADLIWLHYQHDSVDRALEMIRSCPAVLKDKQIRRIQVRCLMALKRWDDVLRIVSEKTTGKIRLDPELICYARMEAGKGLNRPEVVMQACADALHLDLRVEEQKNYLLTLAATAGKHPFSGDILSVFRKHHAVILADDHLSESWARALTVRGHPQDAEKLLDTLLHREALSDDVTESVFILKSAILLKTQNYHELERLAKQGLHRCPGSHELAYFAGEGLSRLEKYGEAIPYLTRALDGLPDHREALDCLRVACVHEGSPKSAIPYFPKYLHLRPPLGHCFSSRISSANFLRYRIQSNME